jgi:hypothetical protein
MYKVFMLRTRARESRIEPYDIVTDQAAYLANMSVSVIFPIVPSLEFMTC